MGVKEPASSTHSLTDLSESIDEKLRDLLSRPADKSDLDDLIQEVYLRFLGAQEQMGEIWNPAAYIHTVAQHVANDFHGRKTHCVPLVDSLGDIGDDTDERADVDQMRRQLTAAIETLPPTMRKVMLLVTNGMSTAETATTLSVTPVAVKALYARAMARVATLLTSPSRRGDDQPE